MAIYDYVVTGNRAAANSLALTTTLFGIALLAVATWFVQRKLEKA